MASVNSNRLSEYTHENGGRVALLFLLFALAIYLFINAGFNAFAVICLSPLAILFVYAAFKWKMGVFWSLIIVNWFIMNRNFTLPIPASLAPSSLCIKPIICIFAARKAFPEYEETHSFPLCHAALRRGSPGPDVPGDRIPEKRQHHQGDRP